MPRTKRANALHKLAADVDVGGNSNNYKYNGPGSLHGEGYQKSSFYKNMKGATDANFMETYRPGKGTEQGYCIDKSRPSDKVDSWAPRTDMLYNWPISTITKTMNVLASLQKVSQIGEIRCMMPRKSISKLSTFTTKA